MVAQVVFCQNLCLWLFIGQENVLKSFWWLKDTAETWCPCLFPIFTMIFVILATLSQDRKSTHDKTLPQGFTKKMGQLDIAFQIWCSVDIFKTKLGTCDKALAIYKCRLLMQTWLLRCAIKAYYKSWVTNWASGHKLTQKNWTNVFSGPKTSIMQLSSCDTGVQKFDERKSQNSILSLLMVIFIVRN